MEQSKQDDQTMWGKGRPSRVEETVRGKIAWDGGTSEYTYHLVYTQESVRVLDMRLVQPGPGMPRHLWRVLRARLIREGYSTDDIGWPESLEGLFPSFYWKIVDSLI